MSISIDDFKSYITSGNPNAPESIRRFDLITKVNIGISILGFVLTLFGQPMMMMAIGGGSLVGLIILALYIFIFYMIVMQAREWAKWVFTVLIATGVLGFIASLSMMPIGMIFIAGAFVGLISLVQMAINIYAVYLLFQQDSVQYFKS